MDKYLLCISTQMLIEAMIVDRIYQGEGVEWEEKRATENKIL